MDVDSRMPTIQGNPEALKKLLALLGISLTEFRYRGEHVPESCNGVIHPPHEIEPGKTFCMGRAGPMGDRILIIVVEERTLYPGRAEGVSFSLSTSMVPNLQRPLERTLREQGPGYVR